MLTVFLTALLFHLFGHLVSSSWTCWSENVLIYLLLGFGNISYSDIWILILYNILIYNILISFLYRSYCLSQFTFGLETTTLNKTSIDFLNISQNNLIRYMLHLKSRSSMTTLLRVLRIHKIDELYISSKLSFLNT